MRGGAGELMQRLPHATLIAHPRAAKHLIDPEILTAGALAVYGQEEFSRGFGQLIPVPAHRVIVAEDEFSLDFNSRRLIFLDTPGHAKHHYSIFDEVSQGFFTGDTFGLSYRELDCEGGSLIFPSTTPVQFDPDAWHHSIERYLQLMPARMFLTHFGMVTDIPKLADDLHRSIDKFVDIAQGTHGATDRHERILTRMTQYLTAEAKRLNPKVSADFSQSLYAFDLELNTQGLEIWLNRQTKP